VLYYASETFHSQLILLILFVATTFNYRDLQCPPLYAVPDLPLRLVSLITGPRWPRGPFPEDVCLTSCVVLPGLPPSGPILRGLIT
jgi:hypothetical protein